MEKKEVTKHEQLLRSSTNLRQINCNFCVQNYTLSRYRQREYIFSLVIDQKNG